jgi:hypothetical protein
MHHSKDKSDNPKNTFFRGIRVGVWLSPQVLTKNRDNRSNAKLGRRDIFKQTTGNEGLHYHSRTNAVRAVKFNASKNLVEPPLMERLTVRLIT